MHLLVAESHLNVGPQSASVAQLVLHEPAGSQANCPQAAGSGSAQPPFPSHAPWRCTLPSVVQPSLPHEVVAPLAKLAHLSRVAPSQVVFAQSVAASASHAERVPCGNPVTGVHVPSLPVTLHASHWPSQALSQQAPSMQRPLAHSSFVPHVEPFRFRQVPANGPSAEHAAPAPQLATPQHTPSVHRFDAHCVASMQVSPSACLPTHAPALQKYPVAHSESIAHTVRHDVAAHP